jgi:hypothetical protein
MRLGRDKPMGKPIEFKKPTAPEPRTDLAAEVAPKLEAARVRLADIEAQASAAALAQALEEPGAVGRLASINAAAENAGRDVRQLEQAHRLAEQRDGMARAAIEAKARQAQLAEFEKLGDARLASMVELCAAIEVAARAYARFLELTSKMAGAMPTGIVPHVVAWHDLETMMPDGRAFPAPIDKIVASEMFRHAPARDDGRHCYLPGAKPLIDALRLQPGAIEPATEGVRRLNNFLVDMIREKFESLERAAAAQFAQSA